MPYGRWLTNPSYSLYLAQQAAVSTILDINGKHEKLISVNGPPGTGKTTLLQDVIADIVIDRAERLLSLDSPLRVFSDEKNLDNGKIYPVKSEIMKNSQIVVASSNNNAVKNISEEIPIKIDRSIFPEFSYFNEVALNKFGNKAWGLVAAPLGSMSNKKEFANKFYDKNDDKDYGLLKDLIKKNKTTKAEVKSILGDVANPNSNTWLYTKIRKSPASTEYVSITDYFKMSNITEVVVTFEKDIVVSAYARKIYKQDCPYSMRLYLDNKKSGGKESKALDEWHSVKNTFQTKLKEFAEYKEHISYAFEAPKRIKQLQEDSINQEKVVAKLEITKANFIQELQKDEQLEALNKVLASSLAKRKADMNNTLNELKRQKKRFWLKLFSPSSYKQKMHEIADFESKLQALNDDIERINIKVKVNEDNIINIKARLENCNREIASVKANISRNNHNIEICKKILGSPLLKSIQSPDYILANYSTDERHLRSSWVNKDLDKLRSELFMLALKLHELTVLSNIDKWEHNIKAISAFLTDSRLAESEEEVTDIWNMLFFITPVVSTTFASFGRLFKGIGKESLGWLLIDEAGQSTPQMAAGAIWRSKRVVVIGDPLQIEPVMTVPNIIVEKMKRHYKVDECFCPLSASVQTVADRTMKYGSYVGDTWVGLPLRAHRRCIDPMFSVSNKIAYDNQMAQANTKPEAISCVLGDSCWFDVQGSSEVQVVQEEIDYLSDTLGKLKENYPTVGDGKEASIYVIAPFRKVAAAAGVAIRKLGLGDKIKYGTVHTFQGKEADIVFIVLGSATGEKGKGSRWWASRKPNLLNVALTRAKLRVYVIGNYADWRNLPYFETLCRFLKPQRI